MRQLVLFSAFMLFLSFGFSQTVLEAQYSKVLWSANDSFTVRFSNLPTFPRSYQISKRDTVDFGTDAVVGIYSTLRFGGDSIRFDYKNLPFAQVHFIHLQSPKGSTVFRLHFNEVRAAFPKEYIQANKGKVQVQIPEVFELANVLWLLSPIGQKATNVNKEGTYYNQVKEYFTPYLNHPVFKHLTFNDSVALFKYYDFRDNSLAFSFENDQIVYKGPYYYISGNDKDYNSLFKQLLPLINDFSQKSGFKKFYRQNRAYYNELINKQTELMPVGKMWSWLEKHFPDKYEAYKIVFSPLISVSHSTQNFTNYNEGYFSETVMFVSGPNHYDTETNVSKDLRQGIASGIVFTEIDHNYVNPVSNRYRKLIDSIFSNRTVWTGADGDTRFYNSPETVFNEYMTHALFSLYVLDIYDPKTAQTIITRREELMVNRRQYVKFKEFNKALIEIYKQNKGIKIADLYPSLLQWCKSQM